MMMAKYRKKPVEVHAEQYQPGEPVVGVTERPAELVLSRDGNLFYVSAMFERMSDCWLPVAPGGDEYPFSMYEIKSGERRPAEPEDLLVQRYLAHMGATAIPEPYACVVTAHGEKTKVVAGDWIIAEPDGRGHYPCKPDIFIDRYEPAD